MATTPSSSNPDTLILGLSEDAYQGDAQFTAMLDGVSLGAAQTVTASHAAGAQQQFTFTGHWGAGPHQVVVKYLNDAYGGTSATDRNLYLASANYDGQAYANLGEGMTPPPEQARLPRYGSLGWICAQRLWLSASKSPLRAKPNEQH